MDRRSPQFSLFSYLEKEATEMQVKERVTYMKPSKTDIDDGLRESAVELKLEEVALPQLISFLGKIESVENVVIIKRVSIQLSKNHSDLLDVILNVTTFERRNREALPN